jgi:hypothetical protein
LSASSGIGSGANDGAPTVNQGKNPAGKVSPALWVLFVILLGALVGVLSYVLVINTFSYYPFMFRGPPGPEGNGFAVFASYLAFHIILSTVSIALLLALIAVYTRTYAKTHASFILGLLVVLLALLIQNLVSYPLLNPFINIEPLDLTKFGLASPVADVFTIIAYTVFLYLSLE